MSSRRDGAAAHSHDSDAECETPPRKKPPPTPPVDDRVPIFRRVAVIASMRLRGSSGTRWRCGQPLA